MGQNGTGALGDGTAIERDSPVQMLPSGVQAVAAGAGFSLILKTDGSLWATGFNSYGQLGDGTTTNRYALVPILSSGVQAIAAGSGHSLILKTDGSLWAMGYNGYGQLGDGTRIDRHTPVPVLSEGVRAIAAGNYHSLVLKTDGSLWGMGNNGSGQLADGTTINRSAPVPILPDGVRAIAAGADHSLMVKTDGSLWTVGGNLYGQLGDGNDGSSANRSTPVEVFTSGVQSVAAGYNHSLVLKADGSLWAMGSNFSGELGDGTNTRRTSPVLVLSGGVQMVAAGGLHSLVVKIDGSLWGTGYNWFGQLGDGTTEFRYAPELIALNVQTAAAGAYHSLFVAGGDIAVHAPTFTTEPSTQTVARAGTAHFTATASGTPAPAYQWWGSFDGGSTWTSLTEAAPYSGTTTDMLTITGTTLAMSGYRFRCVATNGVSPDATSHAATLTVNGIAATVTLGSLSAVYTGVAHSATATTVPQGLNVTFTYNGSAIAPINVGSYTVVGTISDADYQGSASGTLVIAKGIPVITWPAPAAITYGTALSATQLNATASVPGAFVYSPAAGTVLTANIRTLSVRFTPTDATNYATATAAQKLTVNKVVSVITWPVPAAITYGTALSATQLNATASVPGAFVYSPAAGTVLTANIRTLSVRFTPTDATDYSTATATRTLTVTSADSQAFLQLLFQAVLGREADSAELASFGAAMAAGESRSAVLGDLLGSTEYSRRQIEPAIRLYTAAFARPPDYAELQNCTDALHGGALTLAGAADRLAGSAEFLQLHGALDNTQFVQQLHRSVLGRDADAAGLAEWVDRLDAGASRGTVLAGLSESDEFKGNVADQVEILRLHFLLLQRMPTTAELQSWQDFLQGDGQTDDATLTRSDLEYSTNLATLDDQMRDELLADPSFNGS